MADVILRKATMADKDAVLTGIGDCYFGLDYLTCYYDIFVTDPDYNSFVAVDGEEVVGFYSGHIVDGGLTVVKQGGRVKKSHQGRGIFTQLSQRIDQEVSNIVSVRLEAMVCATKQAERVSKGYAKSKGFKKIRKYEIMHTDFVDSDKPRVEPSKVINIKEINPDALEALFVNHEAKKRLIPNKFVLCWVPLQCMKENIYTIFDGNVSMWASVSRHQISPNDDHQVCKTYSDVMRPNMDDKTEIKESTLVHHTDSTNNSQTNKTNDTDKQGHPIYSGDFSDVALISAATTFKCQKGLFCCVNFFAIEDLTDFETHLLHHLYTVQNLNMGEPVTWEISTPAETAELALQKATQCLKPYGLSIFRHHSLDQNFHFERDLTA